LGLGEYRPAGAGASHSGAATMKKRFSIWVREHGSDHDVELCQVENNPQPTVKALHEKRLKLGKGKKIPQYDFVRVVDNHDKL
jgi:hypothetical protein